MVQVNVRTWMLCKWYVLFLYMLHMIDMWMTLFTWMSMWHVNDWEPAWHVLSWVSYAITLWIIWSCQMPVIGQVMYGNLPIKLHSAYSLYTVMCSEAMHSSQKVHSFHTYIWIYDCVKIYLLFNKSWKRRCIFKDEFKYVIEKKG